MKIVATVEARMASSRLPGKVLLPAGDQPLLGHLVNRLRAVPSINDIVLAITTNPKDDPLVKFAQERQLKVFRGSETDVMARVIGAAESAGAEVIVEITGDCPLIDPDIVEQVIRMYASNDAAYVGNAHVRSYPDGMDTQVFSLASLKSSSEMTRAPLDREHVSLHMRNNPDLFPHLHLVAPPSLSWPDLGLTLDEAADYDLLRRLVEYFGPRRPVFSCLEIVEVLRKRPEWVSINRHVRRKGDT